MKSKNYVDNLKGKTAVELREELTSAKKELFNLRFQNATNQLDNTSRIKEVRRNIARIQTVLQSAELSGILLGKESYRGREKSEEDPCRPRGQR